MRGAHADPIAHGPIVSDLLPAAVDDALELVLGLG
jgi:hypothetical protein